MAVSVQETNQLSILDSPNYAKNNYWLNLLKFDPKKEKAITNLFKSNNIQIKKVWYPNHLQKPYKNFQKYNIGLFPSHNKILLFGHLGSGSTIIDIVFE